MPFVPMEAHHENFFISLVQELVELVFTTTSRTDSKQLAWCNNQENDLPTKAVPCSDPRKLGPRLGRNDLQVFGLGGGGII